MKSNFFDVLRAINWLPLGSFPSNEPNTPSSIALLLTAGLLIGLLFGLMRRRSFVVGLIAGGVVFGIAAGVLFWPRFLREPNAPNPGPLLVAFAAISGSCLGAVSALLGKAIHRLLPKRGNRILAKQVGASSDSTEFDDA